MNEHFKSRYGGQLKELRERLSALEKALEALEKELADQPLVKEILFDLYKVRDSLRELVKYLKKEYPANDEAERGEG